MGESSMEVSMRELIESFMDRYYLDDALDKLHPGLSDWVNRNDPSGKKAMFQAYSELSDEERHALSSVVKAAFSKHHGGKKAVLYRRMKRGQDVKKMGGMSLSASIDQSGASHAKFSVDADDVLLHFGVPDTALSSRRFGHEKEIILKKNARPKFLGWVEDRG